jgi:hypothetical protein
MTGAEITEIVAGVPTVAAAIVAVIYALKANTKSNAAVAAVKTPDVKTGN